MINGHCVSAQSQSVVSTNDAPTLAVAWRSLATRLAITTSARSATHASHVAQMIRQA